jgi:predicted lipid-binding transport protein (Tim44 family)
MRGARRGGTAAYWPVRRTRLRTHWLGPAVGVVLLGGGIAALALGYGAGAVALCLGGLVLLLRLVRDHVWRWRAARAVRAGRPAAGPGRPR